MNNRTSDRELIKKRRQQEQRQRIFLTALFLLFFTMLAWMVWSLLTHRFSFGNEQPEQEAHHWYEQTQEVLFPTVTGTATPTATPTVPTATPTLTPTYTPTVTFTPTLSPTPKIHKRTTHEVSPADLLLIAEKTKAAEIEQKKAERADTETWFEITGDPTAADASRIYDNADCTWMGVAGTLTDKRGTPQIGYYVQVGFPDGTLIETLSGLYPNYGESGYELTLARPLTIFEEPIWICVLDDSRTPVSDRIWFRPGRSCDKTLTLINFTRVK